MVITLILSTISFAVTCAASIFFFKWQKAENQKTYLEETIHQKNSYNHELIQKNDDLYDGNKLLQERLEHYLTERTEAVTRLETVGNQLTLAIQERDQAASLTKQAIDARHAAEKQTELAYQQVNNIQKRMDDWEETRNQSMKAAKEAMFETGTQALRKEAENVAEKTLNELKQIIQSVGSLNERVSKNEGTVETVWRALSSPAGAGQLSEIGLENSLKNFGLEQGRDFIMQYAVSGDSYRSSLRPDAVVFLPAGKLLVIDSKASKFFLELAEVEGTEQEKSILDKLKSSMNEHLKSLASKGYKDAVKEYMKAAGNEQAAQHVITVMFLHSEAAVEKLFKADSAFRHRARELGIIISGPTGLAGLMSVAQVEIARERQEKNYQAIISELSGLLGYMETAIDYAKKVGNGIRTAAENYHKFTKSVNTRLLPKGRKLQELGIELPKNKQLPGNLPEYHILTDTAPLIEAEATQEKELELLGSE